MQNIIFMEPVFKDYIWGGNKLKKELKKVSSYEKIAESWEISANEKGDCKIINKEFNNKTLSELFSDINIREEIFGKNCLKMNEFPLLIKFIDANQNLSIQVHPDDEYAHKKGLKNGKNEMWYIMDCDENSQIISGLNSNLNYCDLNTVINSNDLTSYLNYIDVRKGDSIYIKAGTLHSILKGNLICEIQQNSDTTYRVYDWNRVDKYGKSRELHKKESLEVIKSDYVPEIIHYNKKIGLQSIICNKFFKVEKINSYGNFNDCSNLNTFYTMTVVEGEGHIITGTQDILIKKGESFLIPATLGRYRIEGKIQLLRASMV